MDDWSEHGPSVSFLRSKVTGYAVVLVGIFWNTVYDGTDSRLCSMLLQGWFCLSSCGVDALYVRRSRLVMGRNFVKGRSSSRVCTTEPVVGWWGIGKWGG